MNYSALIWKNSMRNKRRTILTVLSVALVLFVLSTLVTFINEIDRNLAAANPLRLITHHAVSLTNPLPIRYGSQIEKVPGVIAVTPMVYYGGIYIDPPHTDFAQFACNPQTLFDIYPEIQIPAEQKQAFIRERTAVVVGRRKAQKHGWKLGDRITIKGSFYPVDLGLTIRGIFDGNALDESRVYFHYAYFEEATGRQGLTEIFWIRADQVDSVPRIVETTDTMFKNTDAPTKTETEQGFSMSFISRFGNLKRLILTISSVIIFTILLVTANTMAMSVRERVREVAVLKALGFPRGKVLGLLIAESILITFSGGLIGCLGARLLFGYFDITESLPGLFQGFEVTWGIIALGLALSILVGLLSTVIPAYRAANLRVADGLRHVG